MQLADFDGLFNAKLAEPLLAEGFVAKSKSLHLIRNNFHIALIRLGGRMQIPGTASSILCLRHSFLRLIEPSSDALKLKFGVFDFPFKLNQKDFSKRTWKLRYESRLLRYDHDRYDFSNLNELDVARHLEKTRLFLLDKFLPTAFSKSPRDVRDEILNFGTNGWCERVWIEDYDSYAKQITRGTR